VNTYYAEKLGYSCGSLSAGNGKAGGELNTIYFTAGPNGEKDGLFGSSFQWH
jgi:hypothetical protein